MARPLSQDVELVAIEAGVSKRLAARLGALARAQIFISDVVLEVLIEEQEPSALKRLLLSPMLMADDRPTREFFAEMIASADDEWFVATPLQLIASPSGTLLCIALADEEATLEGVENAQEAEPAAPQTSNDTPSGGMMVAPREGSALQRRDVESVFKQGDIAQIKLTLLTSTSENEKIEALRKLWLSPIGGDEKLQLFLIALRDSAHGVRSEASRGLGSLGLEGRIANNLARACQADDKERLVALSNLSQLLPHAGAAEEALMVGVATGLLVSSESSPLISQAFDLLEEIVARSKALSDDVLMALHQKIQDLLLVPRPEVLRPLRKLYAALHVAHSALTARMVERSLEEVAPQHLRNFFLSILLASGESKARRESNIHLLLEAILNSDEIDPSYVHMKTALRELKLEAVDAVVAIFQSGGERRRVRLLETIHDLIKIANDREQSDALFRTVLDAFDEGSQRVRMAVYDSSILRSEKLTGPESARAAALLIADLHEYELEGMREVVTGTVLHQGGGAFEATLVAIESSPREVTVTSAAQLLGEITSKWADDPQVSGKIADAIERLVRLLESEDFPNRPALYPVIGRLCAHPTADRARVKELTARFQEEAGRSSATYDIIEALGWICAGEAIDEAGRMELAHVLLGFLELDLPKLSGRLRQTNGEDVLEFGRETTAYTDLIPRMLKGFERIIDRPDLSMGLWGLMMGSLKRVFRRVATYQIIWAPAATLALASILGRAGESVHASEREREEVVELLLLKASILSVVRVLGRLCMSDGSLRMNHLAQQVFERLDGTLTKEEDLEVTERRQILESLAALLRRERIGNDEIADKRIRAKILDHLAGGLKSHMAGISDTVKRVLNEGGFFGVSDETIQRLLSRSAARGR